MNAHETAAYITQKMDLRNGWEITTELEGALEDTVLELMYGDGGSAAVFLRDLARSLEEAADKLD